MLFCKQTGFALYQKHCQQRKDSREKGDSAASGLLTHILRTPLPHPPILKLLPSLEQCSHKLSMQLQNNYMHAKVFKS